jgi:hypothetical protein
VAHLATNQTGPILSQIRSHLLVALVFSSHPRHAIAIDSPPVSHLHCSGIERPCWCSSPSPDRVGSNTTSNCHSGHPFPLFFPSSIAAADSFGTCRKPPSPPRRIDLDPWPWVKSGRLWELSHQWDKPGVALGARNCSPVLCYCRHATSCEGVAAEPISTSGMS